MENSMLGKQSVTVKTGIAYQLERAGFPVLKEGKGMFHILTRNRQSSIWLIMGSGYKHHPTDLNP